MYCADIEVFAIVFLIFSQKYYGVSIDSAAASCYIIRESQKMIQLIA